MLLRWCSCAEHVDNEISVFDNSVIVVLPVNGDDHDTVASGVRSFMPVLRVDTEELLTNARVLAMINVTILA